MEEFISDWFIPMDFGNDMPEGAPDGVTNVMRSIVEEGTSILPRPS